MENQKHVTTLPTEESPVLVDRVIALSPVIRVPLCLARNPALAPWDWRILTALLVFTNDKGCAWPSRKTLAAVLGLPDDDWPTQFYDRLKRIPQRQQNSKTSYHIAPDPDGRCAWMSNAACRYHLDSRGWRILTGLMYVCLSDALAMDPRHDRQGPLEIGPYHHQRILKAAGFDRNRFQRRYLYHALDQFGRHGWLKPGDYPGGYFLQLPDPIRRVSVAISQNPGVHETAKSVHETGKTPPQSVHETGKSVHETGKTPPQSVHETGKSVHETGRGTELEPIKSFLTYIGTESRPGSRPEQPEKKNGKKQEGGLTQGQLQSGSDLKDGFQVVVSPDAAANPGAVVTERQKQLASQLAALNIVPVERLSKYLN